MTIYERALEMIPNDAMIGLGSGRAAWAFVRLLGDRVTAGTMKARGVAASEETAAIARNHGLPLLSLSEAGELAVTVDGADEVDPKLDIIKGYGRALVREKVLATSSKKLIILIGQEKLVSQLGSRGRLPIEVVPFSIPLCERRLNALGLRPTLWEKEGLPAVSDNGNSILDCGIEPIDNPTQLEDEIRRIPGVIGTGLFLGMADTVLIGDERFEFVEERTRQFCY